MRLLVKCLGNKLGNTGCSHRSRSPQKHDNWELWQLCYKCAKILHPEYYKNNKYQDKHQDKHQEKYKMKKSKASIIGASTTSDTINLINKLLTNDKFKQFEIENRVSLSNKTLLVRISLINFIENLPSTTQISTYKAAILNIHEFDNFLKQKYIDNKLSNL